nr:aminoacetone oxidase family FAD-binding enzyme [Lachnospiraceae bacterium]
LLATGNGRCNFTNEYQDESCYRSSNPKLLKSVLEYFNVERTLMEFSKMGVLARNRDGYYYPRSNQAAGVRFCLEQAVRSKNISVVYECSVLGIKEKNHVFFISSSKGEYVGKNIILCTGGKASPKSGSDGAGYEFAKKLGHSIIKPLPALVQLHCREKCFQKLKGIRAIGEVSLFVDGKEIAKDFGELQFTKDGISGIPVFNISRFAVRGLEKRKEVVASIDLFPEFSLDVLSSHLLNQLLYRPTPVSIEDGLMGMLNDRLIPVILKEMGLRPNSSTFDLDEATIRDMAVFFKGWKVDVVGSHDFEFAQVTTGGIDLGEVSDRLESKLQKGLFFAGEILDVDGICGGYNLQWAWSSGYIAGENAAEY